MARHIQRREFCFGAFPPWLFPSLGPLIIFPFSIGCSPVATRSTVERAIEDCMCRDVVEICQSFQEPKGSSVPWSAGLILDSEDVARTMIQRSTRAKDDRHSGSSSHDFGARLSSVLSLLLSATYCCELTATPAGAQPCNLRDTVPLPSSMVSALTIALETVKKSEGLITMVEPNKMQESDEERLVAALEAERSEAIADLDDAVTSFQTELALSCAKRSLLIEGSETIVNTSKSSQGPKLEN